MMFQAEVSKIVKYMRAKGHHITPIAADRNWRAFSDECYSAGFMDVNTERLEQFEEWIAR